LVTMLFPLSLHRYPDLQHLHSFPTRRSSDLLIEVQFGSFKREEQATAATSLPEFHGGTVSKAKDIEQAHICIGYPGLTVKDSRIDRKSTRLNSSHVKISYAVFCLKKKTIKHT